MTMETVVAGKVTNASLAAATAGGAVLGMQFDILGVPVWGLLAGIVGAFCSYLPRHAVDDRDIPMRMLGIVSDAVVGGWIAVFAVHLVAIRGTGIEDMPIDILCGGAGFVMHWLRKRSGPIVEQLLGGVISAITATITSWSRRGGPPPKSGGTP